MTDRRAPEETAELGRMLDIIGWKTPTLAERFHLAVHVAYAVKDGRKRLDPADLDYLRRLAAAVDAVPRTTPTYHHVTLGAPDMTPTFQSPPPENDMDPNIVLTTLVDVYREEPEARAGISAALDRLGLIEQAKVMLRVPAPQEAEREPMPG